MFSPPCMTQCLLLALPSRQIFAGGHISSHFNPAIALGVALRTGLRSSEVPMLLALAVVQITAATIAALLGLYITDAVRRSKLCLQPSECSAAVSSKSDIVSLLLCLCLVNLTYSQCCCACAW